MTRANARELAVHLIYSREFTGEEPQQIVTERLEKDYYTKLAQENEVYAERPNGAQVRYLDTVVTGVANRTQELNEQIGKFSIGWDVSRISRLTRCVMQLAIFEILYMDVCPPALPFLRLSALQRNTMAMTPVRLSTESWVPLPEASPPPKQREKYECNRY